MLINRPSPERSPFTFMSCTGNDDDVEWMKECEEKAPYCSEFDDYGDESREILKDQGKAFPYSFGLHLREYNSSGDFRWKRELRRGGKEGEGQVDEQQQTTRGRDREVKSKSDEQNEGCLRVSPNKVPRSRNVSRELAPRSRLPWSLRKMRRLRSTSQETACNKEGHVCLLTWCGGIRLPIDTLGPAVALFCGDEVKFVVF